MDMKSKRRQFMIDPSFQINFIFKFCLIVMISSFLIGAVIFALTQNSTTVAIENTKVLVKPTADYIWPGLFLTVVVVTLFSALVVLLLTLFVSHKISGPIFRLRREIDKMSDGDLVRNFNIREKDQLQALAHSLNLMANSLRAKQLEQRNACLALVQYLEERDFVVGGDDKEAIKQLIDELHQALDLIKA